MSLPTIHLFDTMSGEKRPLEPITPGAVGIYVCGVTVYDLTHVGHGRVFVSFDVITRYLRYRGYDVTYVRNHTDIDDKIIKRANELEEDPLSLAERFIAELDEDMGGLGVQHADVEPRVTGHIDQIIAMVERLVERGHAYEIDGDVYFDVESFDGYGKLSGRKLEDMRAGERVAVDERKKNPFDFALWKSQKPGEPAWDSPWGPGRPGWHIECSAMSTEHLGPSFDIHGGGKDLVFPHHENEIAQSEGATGHPFAKYWMHVGLVNIEGEKMSKSLGNVWNIRDVRAAYHPETVRYFMMTAHYRKPISYTRANLDLARHRIDYLYRTRMAINELLDAVDARPQPSTDAHERYATSLHEAMDDDFNSPGALAVIAEAGRRANEIVSTKKVRKKRALLEELAGIDRFFDGIAQIFGFLGSEPREVLTSIRTRLAEQLGVDAELVEEKIAARKSAREEKRWEDADAIRDDLVAMGVELMDSADGTDWRVTPPEPELDEQGLTGADDDEG